ncbi:MAG: hypothetical protein HEP71_31345 [Roseivirga sp.]|nr:hypothetical protein [Roseivirga sp.]
MSSFRVRPRFNETLSLSQQEFKDNIQGALDSEEGVTGSVSDTYCVLKIPLEERHYWSPQLTLTLEQEEDENKELQVRGLYGPKPSVWAAFFMSYAAIGILILFIGVIGMSQAMLSKPSPILWAIPVLALVALILYLVAQSGQKVGAEQMFRIHHFYEALVKHRVAIK